MLERLATRFRIWLLLTFRSWSRGDDMPRLCDLHEIRGLEHGIHGWQCPSSNSRVYVELNTNYLIAGHDEDGVTAIAAIWSIQDSYLRLIDVRGDLAAFLNPTLDTEDVEARIWTLLICRSGTMVKTAPPTRNAFEASPSDGRI